MNKSEILGGLKDLWTSEQTKQDQRKTIQFGKFLNSNDYNEDRFQPIVLSKWNENTMEALLTIRCYICNKITDNCGAIIIRKTGKKLFRISTNCSKCSKFKSKKFCDTFTKLPNDMYKLTSNKIYVDYTSTGIRFVDLL